MQQSAPVTRVDQGVERGGPDRVGTAVVDGIDFYERRSEYPIALIGDWGITKKHRNLDRHCSHQWKKASLLMVSIW